MKHSNTSPKNTVAAAIITGGGRGIGRDISMRLAQTMPVFIVGRTKKDLQDTCKAIRAVGGTADYLVGDITDAAVARQAVVSVAENGWTVRHLVCNAGVGKSSPAHEISEEAWRSIVDVNLHGSFYFAQAVLPLFVGQQAGTLCFVSSLAGVKGYAYEAAYTASKHAVVGLAKSLALEYGKHGIVSVPLCPGFVESEMTTRTIVSLANRRGITEDESREVIARINPQRRIIPAEEVAEMVAFICGNTVPSLSGNPIIMGGGA
jgi:NAD(P)-dependent dehydrogenase (short-subunit alcohol dehydrogenase family)